MNGRRLHREYLISLGLDCHSFIEIESEYYEEYIVHYKDSKGVAKSRRIIYKDMVHWLIRVSSNKVFDHMSLGE